MGFGEFQLSGSRAAALDDDSASSDLQWGFAEIRIFEQTEVSLGEKDNRRAIVLVGGDQSIDGGIAVGLAVIRNRDRRASALAMDVDR